MSTKRTTMADIAKTLGVSKNAVSLALGGKEGVSDALRARVLETAAAMDYPRAVQPPIGGCILALIPRYLSTLESGTFYQQVCFHMEAYAQSRGYQLIISSVSEAEAEAQTPPALLESIACSGIMTIGNLPLPYCRMIDGLGLRYLMVDQYYDELVVNSVSSTNTAGAYLLTRHLLEHGHSVIEYFGKYHTTASLRDRWEGYCRAMQEAGLSPRHNTYQLAGEQQSDAELIRAAMRAMDRLPTAVVCGHDNTAKEVVDALDEMGLRYPGDVSVVGFDDIQRPEVARLALTTYNTRKADIAHAAIDLFIDGAGLPCRKVLIYGEIIYRDSVRPPRP